jgi:hypothetical protein
MLWEATPTRRALVVSAGTDGRRSPAVDRRPASLDAVTCSGSDIVPDCPGEGGLRSSGSISCGGDFCDVERADSRYGPGATEGEGHKANEYGSASARKTV